MIDQRTAASEPKSALPQDIKQAGTDIAGIPERFTVPGFDRESFVTLRPSDIDAVTKAASVAAAGAQTVVDKQAELLKTVLAQLGEALSTLPHAAAEPATFLRRLQDLTSDVLSSVLKTLKEIADTVCRSQSGILELAASRIRGSAARPVQPEKNVPK